MKLLNDIFFIKEYYLKDKTSDAKFKINLLQIKMSSSLSVSDSVNHL